jgi:small-conductance mechanosensitive channel
MTARRKQKIAQRRSASAVTNWTLSDRRMVEIDVCVARSRAGDCGPLLRRRRRRSQASRNPAPRARLNELGANRTYRLYVWIDDVDRSVEVKSALRMAIAKKFSEARVEIK